jgi:hypothetical protein
MDATKKIAKPGLFFQLPIIKTNFKGIVNTSSPLKKAVFCYDIEATLNDRQRPKGAYIPLKEWQEQKHGIHKGSELYQLMNELSIAETMLLYHFYFCYHPILTQRPVFAPSIRF